MVELKHKNKNKKGEEEEEERERDLNLWCFTQLKIFLIFFFFFNLKILLVSKHAKKKRKGLWECEVALKDYSLVIVYFCIGWKGGYKSFYCLFQLINFLLYLLPPFSHLCVVIRKMVSHSQQSLNLEKKNFQFGFCAFTMNLLGLAVISCNAAPVVFCI